MPIKADADDYAVERSTFAVLVTFRDETETLVEPSAVTWTLTDEDGTVINSRLDVIEDDLASTMTILLSGDDLALGSGFAGTSEKRFLTIEAVYSSDLGFDLPLRESYEFLVYNLVAVP